MLDILVSVLEGPGGTVIASKKYRLGIKKRDLLSALHGRFGVGDLNDSEDYDIEPSDEVVDAGAYRYSLSPSPSAEEPPAKKSKSLPGGPSSQDGSLFKEEQVFWENLSKAELEKVNLDVKVSDAEEATVHEVTILKLQENSTFMGSLSERSKIMVPKFYEDLWKIAEDLMGKAVHMRMLITGTPGTGKSVMGWYFIYMLRNKLGSFDLVYQHERSKLQYFYSKDGPVTVGFTSLDLFRSKLSSADTVYVVDGAGALELTAKTFIFVSPDAKGNTEIKKVSSMKSYYSKVWSKIDILAARQLLYEDVDERSVRKLYMKWGGVPRHVLEKANDRTWQQELPHKTAMVPGSKWIDCVTNVGGTKGTTDVALHYRTEDYQNFTVDFATTHLQFSLGQNSTRGAQG